MSRVLAFPVDTAPGAAAADQPFRLTVIVTNFNYGRFVARAIESVLSQAAPIEIIVIDDASTDNSREVLGAFANRCQIIFKEKNSGQASGFNIGYAHATGDLVMFLDADDFLMPGAFDILKSAYNPGTAMYAFRMQYADEADRLSGSLPAADVPIAKGDISEQLRTVGSYVCTITSGMVFSRAALEKVMPIPEEAFRMCADGYLSSVVPMYGPVVGSDRFFAAYRLHQSQFTTSQQPLGARARKRLAHDEDRYRAIRDHARQLNLAVADTVGEKDPMHVFERIVSIVFEPDAHPYKADRPGYLFSRLIKLKKPAPIPVFGSPGVLSATIFSCVRLMPTELRRVVLRWMLVPRTAPRFLKALAGLIKRRSI